MGLRIAVLGDWEGVSGLFGPWADLGPDFVIETIDRSPGEEALIRALRGVDVVVAMRERVPLPARVIAGAGTIRLLVTTGMENAAIDVEEAERQGILVCGTRSMVSPTVELTWALILAATRRIADEDRGMRGGHWPTTVGLGLEGATIGIVGLGKVGSRVARLAAGFGMRVTAWSPHLTAEEARAQGATRVTRRALFAESDVVTIHLRQSARTEGLIREGDLRIMGSHAVLVNTSRAAIVDQDALTRALRERWIGAAGLDVFEEEPLPPDHALRRLPRTVLTSHRGFAVESNLRLYYEDAVAAILAWRAGSPIRQIGSLHPPLGSTSPGGLRPPRASSPPG